ncbi:MAG TPA: oxygenase MpaB family protein [Candidatus Saccharimonadia bacterium]|nr:oxygenase MpaB family protein [Candidatus Saccharimonadia bacterium]
MSSTLIPQELVFPRIGSVRALGDGPTGMLAETVIGRALNYVPVSLLTALTATPALLADPRLVDALAQHYGEDKLAEGSLSHVALVLRGVLQLVLGDEDVAAQTVRKLVKRHGSIAGRLSADCGDFSAGMTYKALDPALLTSVLAKLIIPLNYLAGILPLEYLMDDPDPRQDLDFQAGVITSEGRSLAMLFGLEQSWPSTHQHLDEQLDALPQGVSPLAVSMVRAVLASHLTPPLPYGWWLLVQQLAMRLPGGSRIGELYGWEPSWTKEQRTAIVMSELGRQARAALQDPAGSGLFWRPELVMAR